MSRTWKDSPRLEKFLSPPHSRWQHFLAVVGPGLVVMLAASSLLPKVALNGGA